MICMLKYWGAGGGGILIPAIYFEMDPKTLKWIDRWTEGDMSM